MKPFVFDFETFLIVPARQVPRAVCLALEGRLLHAKFDSAACERVLREALLDPDVLLIGANVAYDLAVAWNEWPALGPLIWAAYDAARVWDIQTAEKLIDLYDGYLPWHPHPTDQTKRIKVGYSLAEIAGRRFPGTVMDKTTWRMRYGTLLDTRIEQWEPGAKQYPLHDVGWTRAIFDLQWADDEAKLADVGRQTRAGWWMLLMTARGFAVDGPAIEKFDASIRLELESIASKLMPVGLVTPEGKRSKTAAAARLTTVLALRGEAPVMTLKGQVKLRAEQCEDSGDWYLIAYARWTSLTGMLTKVGTLREAAVAGMPIQSRFEVLVASGRTSCSGGKAKKGQTGPNRSAFAFQLQNMNREPGLRECFVPRPGYLLASLDYGQLELCTWAEVCIYLGFGSKLGELLNAGVDVHSKLGARLFKLEYDWVVANKKTDKRASTARQGAKPVNFGAPGGMREKGMCAYAKTQYGVIFTLEEARKHLAAWGEEYPESEPYFAHTRSQVRGGWGRIRQVYSDRMRGGCGFTDGNNTPFQGLAADAAKAAGYDLARAMYTGRDSRGVRYHALEGCFNVDFVHDEFIFEAPEDRAHEACVEAKEIMERVAAEWIPHVPPKVEPALMRRLTKEAGPKYANGRLVPWEPKT